MDLKIGHLVGPAVPLLPVTVHSGDKSRDKDHRSDCGSYYPDDQDRYCPNRYYNDRFYDFDSRYSGWGYERRSDDRGGYWPPPPRFPPPLKSDDCCSINLRDMHPWGDSSFRDR